MTAQSNNQAADQLTRAQSEVNDNLSAGISIQDLIESVESQIQYLEGKVKERQGLSLEDTERALAKENLMLMLLVEMQAMNEGRGGAADQKN